MIVVDILTSKERPISSLAVIEPLFRNRRLFGEVGINIRHLYLKPSQVRDANILILDSKALKRDWSTSPDRAFSTLHRLKSLVDKLFFYDSSDSTGTIQGQVLSFVDQYLKAQVLRDKLDYQRPLYGERVYTDFFFSRHKVQDSQEVYSKPLTLAQTKKIHPAWNVGLAGGYGTALNPTWRFLILAGTGRHIWRPNRYKRPDSKRELDLLARMTINQSRESVAYQRTRALEKLAKYQPTSTAVTKQKYLAEMKRAKIILAPFAWGEMNMRDYECFALGGLLVKPRMSHVKTFPDFYLEDETYIAVDWSLSDLEEKIDFILENYEDLLEVARRGQEKFRFYSDTLAGQQEFVNYASKLFHVEG